MAQQDVSQMFATLFTAPSLAMVDAAAKQRAIWVDWLKDLKKVLGQTDAANQAQVMARHLDMAPVWQLDAQVSAGIQMRVATIDRSEGSFSLGLGVATGQVAGSFGFASESTSESMFQARAQYAFSNGASATLRDYLTDMGVTLSPDQLDTAIAKLEAISVPAQTDD